MGDSRQSGATVRRVRLGDGQPPAYLITSPCCGVPTLIQAWMADYVRANRAGHLRVACGHGTGDPLLAQHAAGRGCGRRFLIRLDQDPPTVDGSS